MRLTEYGANRLPEHKHNPILVYLGYMWNPLSWAMEVRSCFAVCAHVQRAALSASPPAAHM